MLRLCEKKNGQESIQVYSNERNLFLLKVWKPRRKKRNFDTCGLVGVFQSSLVSYCSVTNSNQSESSMCFHVLNSKYWTIRGERKAGGENSMESLVNGS